jgi:hypothetical protein
MISITSVISIVFVVTLSMADTTAKGRGDAEPIGQCWDWSYMNPQGTSVVRLGGRAQFNPSKDKTWQLAEVPEVKEPLLLVEVRSPLRLNKTAIAQLTVLGSDAPRLVVRGRWHEIPSDQKPRSVIWLASEVAGVFLLLEQCDLRP